MASSKRVRNSQTRRFGIGEWYGFLFTELSAEQRRTFAELQLSGTRHDIPRCPFLSTPEREIVCNKKGGVCSLRLYELQANAATAHVASGELGRLRTVCPNRFEEDRLIYRWVSETLLGVQQARIAPEVSFLQRLGSDDQDPQEPRGREDVGRIDKVLVVPNSDPLMWCALEVQAVYFSGREMAQEWHVIRNHPGPGIPFPAAHRRPDYRSSGPKRLMPQLQIKVPSLRRWGKKMAVVVDEDFWAAMAPMETVRDVSNCDIAWFVVGYDEERGRARLRKREVYFTTLERSIEGLTAGVPVSLEVFEQQIRAKLRR